MLSDLEKKGENEFFYTIKRVKNEKTRQLPQLTAEYGLSYHLHAIHPNGWLVLRYSNRLLGTFI
jgi:hypothetical protein